MTRRIALVRPRPPMPVPNLARVMATHGHDLVISDPEPGLVEELEVQGPAVWRQGSPVLAAEDAATCLGTWQYLSYGGGSSS